MPFSNVPAALQGKMESCVTKVKKQGFPEENAIRICYRSVVEGVALPPDRVGKREILEAAALWAPVREGGAVFTGRTWDVTIIGPNEGEPLLTVDGIPCLKSRNNHLYAVDGLKESVPLWEGIKVYDNHLTDAEFQAKQGMRSVQDEWVGVLTNPRWDEASTSLRATLQVVDDGIARKLKNAHEQKVLRAVGLSIDTVPVWEQHRHEGRSVRVARGFKRIFSVDVVGEPAAGGSFDRLMAAISLVPEVKEMAMTPEQIAELKAIILEVLTEMQAEKDAAAAAAAGGEGEGTPATVAPAALEATPAGEATPVVEGNTAPAAGATAPVSVVPVTPVTPVAAPAAAAPDATPAAPVVAPVAAVSPATVEGDSAMADRIAVLESTLLLNSKLDAAKLPPEFRAVVEASLAGRACTGEEMDMVIKRTKEAQASTDPSGRVAGAGGARTPVLRAGFDGAEQAEIALMRLVAGTMDFRALEGIKTEYVQDRIPESYKAWIKDGRPNTYSRKLSTWLYDLLDGDPMSDPRAYEAVTSSSMSSMVKNTVNLLLAADYSKRTEWWAPIVKTESVETIDTATLVRLYGLSTLDIVAEGGPYTELDWADEEETATFVKKGNYVGVTLETFLQDKLGKIKTLPNRLANSWFNTKSALAAAVFTTNTLTGPDLADTGALFNSTAIGSTGGHVNLLTVALSFTSYAAARVAMMKQTDQPLGVGAKLLIQPRYLLVPVDLEATAIQIRNSEMLPNSANNDVNPFFQKFDVIVVPEWTDTADWALVADPAVYPAIFDINVRGRVTPELFTSDSETEGGMFTNDTLRYKVRMLTFRFSSSFECLPVADFRPLHKSNV